MYNKIFNDNKNNYVIETVENWNSGILDLLKVSDFRWKHWINILN